MCGIVAAIAQRDVYPILLEGLRRLEYRGYDSAGIAVVRPDLGLARHRRVGKVANLDKAFAEEPLPGGLGIAHTRWATHGRPKEANAHPHICNKKVAVVHNGIIENYQQLRREQEAEGYVFTSETDTEVIAHQVSKYLDETGDLLEAITKTTADLTGAYALGVVAVDHPDELVVVREGSPLVIGLGIGEHFAASDVQALLPVTSRFIYLENGDFAKITRDSVTILDSSLNTVTRPVKSSRVEDGSVERGSFKHFMLKEIYEQPKAVSDTLRGRLSDTGVDLEALLPGIGNRLDSVEAVQIIACGTSYHAGLVAKYWIEQYSQVSCNVEVASEFRYRSHVVAPNSLFLTISQSGETADTLAALREAKTDGYALTLAVCNVPESSLDRESDFALHTEAGPEIGVASTKAFTTQLVALQLLATALAIHRVKSTSHCVELLDNLRKLPLRIEAALELDESIERLCQDFLDKEHALFLGRGVQYPIAMEGALKLKEISYIHAEAYPAGELKHGPLALVDENMPVIAVAPNDSLYEKLKSNLEEVKARGGRLYVFAESGEGFDNDETTKVLEIPPVEDSIAPIVNVVYLQLLSYHTAVLKGTDVDQPRNLAKSVTVE
ncbi:MAG: glutamine--fructose-6-phosphate transaminase (isomerizing) [bacterium]